MITKHKITHDKAIAEDSEKAAIETAVKALSYSENTVKQMREKLLGRGFSELNTEAAIKYVVGRGYLNEEEFLRSLVAACAQKYYGRRRIYMEAMARGFDRNLISEKFDNIVGEINFEVNCSKLIQKLNYPDMNKLITSLTRYGYTIDEVRTAYKLFMTKGRKKV